eukprot:2914394-Rhodomonas_salina.1
MCAALACANRVHVRVHASTCCEHVLTPSAYMWAVTAGVRAADECLHTLLTHAQTHSLCMLTHALL